MPLAPGTRLGPYEIVAKLGAGGMGVVYRARDTRLQREVAIKLLPPGLLIDDTARRRFRKEALALAKLSHPNIATVHDVGEQDGADYLVMECVPGESLATRLKSGRLSVVEALSLGVEIAAALEEAHEQGVVHRDLKPGNIMVTPKGHAKVLDFGLAKLLGPDDSERASQALSETGSRVGTTLYMSPEQAFGETVDARTDLWSLGVVLYESLAGRPPFHGPGEWAVLRAVSQEEPAPLSGLRPEVPPEVERIVSHALTKDVTRRYQTAAEIGREVAAALAGLSAPPLAPVGGAVRPPARYLVSGAILFLLLLAGGGWFYLRSERRHWAREVALPEIARLTAADRGLAAFLLLRKAEQFLPADTAIAAAESAGTRIMSITTTPPGATVDLQDYVAPDSAWYRLGETPLTRVRVPRGFFRWKISRPGLGEYVAALSTNAAERSFSLDSLLSAPEGMVRIEADDWADMIAFVGWVGPYHLPTYFFDRFEVTNRQYQLFVDQGGYDKPEYWREPLVRDGRPLSREQAMPLFRDRTGRAGPAGWEGGHYPEGQADYPVSGVSWYEASAYAVFVHKSLPTFAQWFEANPEGFARLIVQASNISRTGLAPVGKFRGLGTFGTYDMAGNVREWVENGVDAGRRLLLGGAWNSLTYIYSEAEALSPFDRSATNGFRCVRNLTPLAPAVTGPITTLQRDFAAYRPASDEVFRAYRVLYAYDSTPLNARVDAVVQDAPDWRKERITFDAAYGNERMAAYLFLPKRVRPPYQTVVFFPSARVLDLTDSRQLGDTAFFDYVVQSGRAVLYPVYKETYERRVRHTLPGQSGELTGVVQRYKDLARSLDYLGTRADIAKDRLAYLGVSMGSAEGVIYTALEQQRLKAVIFLDGGYFLDQPPPGGDQADFAPRLTLPVLMVNGRFDFVFPLGKAQDPFFRMLGTPAANKRHVVLETPHDVTADRPALVREVLGWLDRYLGRVD